jgi:cell wall-associated NlpC family hydrolase
MDCSNATRWIYQQVYGRQLPRTASAQYEYFLKRGEFRRTRPNAQKLRQVLRPGDLLFWEHTYRPKRKPPVTHVMTYLGHDPAGRMLMVGAQSSRGLDIYHFDPEVSLGGYRWFLWFRRESRFIGYARPGW